MDVLIPNLHWYFEQSTAKGISPRCPFANIQSCPRFYQSLSLLGKAGNTAIPEKEDKKLLKKWRKSPLWSISKKATSLSGPEGSSRHFWNFCPEVSFERFGLFASHLDKYVNEIEIGFTHSQLSKWKAPPDDWRWNWSSIKPQHYSECPLYSALVSQKEKSKVKYEDVIELKPNIYVIGMNINALFRRINEWWIKCKKIMEKEIKNSASRKRLT